MKPAAPQRVDDIEKYWSDRPPERSPRCAWWMQRIRDGWRPNSRISCLGYYSAARYYGVYIWEYCEELSPLLDELSATTTVAG